MEHPAFEEIEQFVETGQPESIKFHMEQCEECNTIAEGLGIIVLAAEKKGVSTSEFIEGSANRSLGKVKLNNSDSKTRVLNPRWFMMAASIVIIALLTFLISRSQPKSPEELVAMALQVPYNAPVEIRSGTTQDSWDSFREYYAEQDFDQAYALLETQPDSIMNSEKYFYKGLTMIYSSKPDFPNAINIFKDLASGKSRYSDHATWFQSLCLIQIGDRKSAIPLLEKLIQQNGFKATEAKKLLDIFPSSQP